MLLTLAAVALAAAPADLPQDGKVYQLKGKSEDLDGVRFSIRKARPLRTSACPSAAPTLRLADRRTTACTWRAAIRSTRSMSSHTARPDLATGVKEHAMDLPAHRLMTTVLMTPDMANRPPQDERKSRGDR